MVPSRSDFVYHLPPELVAQKPLAERQLSRMMVLRRSSREVVHTHFSFIDEYLRAGDLLVLNDTRVIPARLFGTKEPGSARVEILLVRPLADGCWKVLVRPGRRLRPGSTIRLAGGARAVAGRPFDDGTREVALHTPLPWEDYLQAYGITPLPPYIRRLEGEDELYHRARYQTVYAAQAGSVAAPTAGLHFTPAVLESLAARGVETATITLHVGPGTFKPVQTEDLSQHRMDEEFFCLEAAAAVKIEQARRDGRRVIAVGTTTTRTLEFVASRNQGELRPVSGWTDLFITPGFRFQVVSGLLTNFHLPGSTLIMLVSALAGREWTLACYEEAVQRGYRFYSYGDCMLIV